MRKSNFAKICTLSIIAILIGGGCGQEPKPINIYYLPNNYVGAVKIAYNVPGTPSLEMDGRYRIVRVPQSGIVETSSPAIYGREISNCSETLGRQYYYVDEKNNIIRRLSRSFCPNPEIRGESTGDSDTAYFSVGTEDDVLRKNHCYGGRRQTDGTVIFPDIDVDSDDIDPQEFHIPDQYVGWVKITYQSQGHPELPIDPESGYFLHHIPDSGILLTSSKAVRKPKLSCGQKRKNFFYSSNLPKESRRLTESDMIWKLEHSAINSIYTFSFFVGTLEEYKKYGFSYTEEEKKFGGKRLESGTVIFPE